MPVITALYAGILGLLAIGLAVAIGRVRAATGVSIGDGDDVEVIAAMRRHANFVEFVPISLVLLALLELNGVGGTALHVLGAGLVLSRLSHAVGYRADESINVLRAIGAVSSTVLLATASIWAIALFFF